MESEKKPRKQCAKCPWKADADPNEIPGYNRKKHRRLRRSIAEPGALHSTFETLMACHESKVGKEIPCAGWLANQLGPGNNIPLRLAVITGQLDDNFELDGPQHARFEDTICPSRR